MFYLNIQNKRGMSLIEVMMAAAVATIVSLGIATMMANNAKSSKTIQTMSEANDLKSEIVQRYTVNSDTCLAHFAGKEFKNAINRGDKVILGKPDVDIRNAKNKINATASTLLSDNFKNRLLNRINSNLVNSEPNKDKTNCIGSVCQYDQIGNVKVNDIHLEYEKNLSPGLNMRTKLTKHQFNLILSLEQPAGIKIRRDIPVILQTIPSGLRDQVIIDCKSFNSAVSSLEVCDPNDASKCYTYDEIKPLMELLEPLIDGNHLAIACLGSSGKLHDAPGGKICRFPGNSCPAGWVQHDLWSATASRFYSGCHSSSCNTGSHTFANRGQESCRYKTRSSWGNCSRSHTGFAAVIEVGCK